MARIRTIKPEFFTSEDIVSLSPLARLLYIALWCEADKDGRMVWKPITFKLRYLPGDACDVHALCKEITDRGLIVLYGEGFAYVPAFAAHQHVNPREAQSQLPDPDAISTRGSRVGTRAARVSAITSEVNDAQVGREGKGRERKGGSVHASQAPPAPPTPFSEEFQEVIKTERPDLDGPLVFAGFCEHFEPDKRTAVRWRKWVISEHAAPQSATAPPSTADPDSRASVEALGLARGLGNWNELAEPWHSYKARVRGSVGVAA